jgi:HK97 family phage portal protein
LRVFGFEITKAAPPAGLSAVGDRGNWWSPIIRESFSGAWQRNIEVRAETLLTFHAVYACVTRIAQDIGKLRIKLVEQDSDGIWSEVTSPAFSPVLRKPNRYQNRIKFVETWIASKLLHGNTYGLKERDNRGVVVALYVLDPHRVRVLVAPDGSVYYQLSRDYLSGIEDDQITVPASEIVHDIMIPLYHPLVGVSPLHACGSPAMLGSHIQRTSARFFENGARPSGILSAPGKIEQPTADRLKEAWAANYGGENTGRIAVLGDGLKFEKMSMTALDAQLIEQLKLSAENVCSAFHVPGHMVGVGSAPTYNNVEALNQQYYTQCLQAHVESLELCLDEGLGLVDVPGRTLGTEVDIEGLWRMDTATQYDTLAKGVQGSILAPNEARKKLDLKPAKGGDSPMAQHQDYSLEALARRDAMADPFGVAPAVGGNPKPPLPAAPVALPAPPDAPPPTKDAEDFDPEYAGFLLAKELGDPLLARAA